MFILIIGLIVIVCLLLILVVLAQNSKGGGLSSQFGGGGAGSQLIGVKKTGDLLERVTWGLAISLVVLTLSSYFVMPTQTGPARESVNVQSAQEKTVMPNNLQQQNTTQPQGDALPEDGAAQPLQQDGAEDPFGTEEPVQE